MLKSWIYVILFNLCYNEVHQIYFNTNKLTKQTQWTLPFANGALLGNSCPCTFCGKSTYCHGMGHQVVPLGLPKRQVTRLLLNGNKITEIYGNDLRGMINLKELNLDHNNLTILNKNSLEQLYSLNSLHLEYNKLVYIRPGVLKQVPKLINLYLDHNDLTTFPGDISYLANLEKLNLAHNQIKKIVWSSFYRLNNLRFLSIQDNPIICGCETKQLTNWFKSTPSSGSMLVDYLTTRCLQNDTVKYNCTRPTIQAITQQSTQYSIGDQVILQCSTTGNPQPLVMWQTPSSGFIFPYKDSRIQAHLNGSLVINDVTISNRGTYTCYAQLSDGLTDTSKSIILRLSERRTSTFTPPATLATNFVTTATQNIEIIEVTEGSETMLLCKVQGFSPNLITWYHSKEVQILTIKNNSGQYVLNDNILVIQQTKLTDEGEWGCKVRTESGQADTVTLFNITVLPVSEEGNTPVVIISAIAGAVVVIIIVVVIAILYITKKRKRRKKTRQTARPKINVIIPNPLPPSSGSEINDESEVEAKDLQQPFEFEPEVRGFRL